MVIKTKDKNECGKSDRCRHDVDCLYLHYPLANYLCFDNKRLCYDDMKEYQIQRYKKKGEKK